jgi:DNA-binding transcriptional ArsR family regulator
MFPSGAAEHHPRQKMQTPLTKKPRHFQNEGIAVAIFFVYPYFVIWRNSEGDEMAVSEVFRALSDPTRREILMLLRSGDKSAGEIADQFPLARSTLSGHFNVLKAAGMVVTERRATTIVYSLNVSAFEEAMGALMELLHFGEPQETVETLKVTEPIAKVKQVKAA